MVGDKVAEGSTETTGVLDGTGSCWVTVGEAGTVVFVGVPTGAVDGRNVPVGVSEGLGEGDRVFVGGEHIRCASDAFT
jgi:hypothetical protein